MEIIYTVHDYAGQNKDQKLRRTGAAAKQLIDTAEQVIKQPLKS